MNAPAVFTKNRCSAAEMAEMLGVNQRTVGRWAQVEQWPFVLEAEGGVVTKKYLVALLPPERHLSLVGEHQAPAPGEMIPIEETAPPLPKLTELKAWQREIMDARLALFREYQRMERSYGTARAIKEFCRAAKAGDLPPHLQALVAVANARGGESRAISKSTIYRWKAMDASGNLAAFAPKDIEKNEVPDWAPYFLKCYQRPQKPSVAVAMEEMQAILPAHIEMPSYGQVRRFQAKRSRLDIAKGRHTGSELQKFKGFVRRSTENMLPMDIGQCDGHSFKARVAHPEHGRPFHPEVCAVIDWKTRVCTGWSAWLSESAMTVSGAILHSLQVTEVKPYGGTFAMLYSDKGAGNLSHMVSNEVVGILARCGTEHVTGRPGNPQGRGLVERSNVGLWIAAAKSLETFTGKEMDKGRARHIYLVMDREVKKTGTCTNEMLPSWEDFLRVCQQAVDSYNRRPHSSLPKITDPQTKRVRHMAPLEYWAQFLATGWRPSILPAEVLDDISRPQMARTTRNCEVSVFGNFYYAKALEDYHGLEVIVEYDVHDAKAVRVRDKNQRLICTAQFERNVREAFPVTAVERNREQRAKRRLALIESKRQEIEDERRGMLEQEADQAMMIDVDEGAVARVLEDIEEVEMLPDPPVMDETPVQTPVKEAGNEASMYCASGTLTERYHLIRADVLGKRRAMTDEEWELINEFYETDNGRLYLSLEPDLREIAGLAAKAAR